MPRNEPTNPAAAEAKSPLTGDWLFEEFRRAEARLAELPRWARPARVIQPGYMPAVRPIPESRPDEPRR